MAALKNALKAAIALTPYRIVRARQPVPRFQAIPAVLEALARRGYGPKTVIDGGANVGDFARLAHRVFPEAAVHMVEPQPGCRRFLERLPHALHAVALVAPEQAGTPVYMAAEPDGHSTGAYVASEGLQVPGLTLDDLFAAKAKPSDRIFLKLDLQGYELNALRGAERLLPCVEVVLAELSLFAQAHEPPPQEVIGFLAARGLELFEVASLTGRHRDNRLRQADFVFVRRGSALSADTAWA